MNCSGFVAWTASVGLVCGGLAGLRSAFDTFRIWQEYVASGDISGAEAYEVEFWPKLVVSVFIVILGAFSAGRLSRRP